MGRRRGGRGFGTDHRHCMAVIAGDAEEAILPSMLGRIVVTQSEVAGEVAGAMKDREDRHAIGGDLIDEQVGQPRHRQLAGAGKAAGAPHLRKAGQTLRRGDVRAKDLLCGGRVV